MSLFYVNESFILLKSKLENVKNGKEWVGFELGINWLQDWCLSLHGYPGAAEKCMNLYAIWLFSVGHIIWQATAIFDG